jgi:hypothetical protein
MSVDIALSPFKPSRMRINLINNIAFLIALVAEMLVI